MTRFVVLEHDHPVLHWDLMLETDGVLRTWRLAETPQPGHTILAEASFDHRLQYLEYEGPIAGARGSVSRWDAGTYELGYESTDELSAFLKGRRLSGRITLRKMGGDAWQFAFDLPTDSHP